LENKESGTEMWAQAILTLTHTGCMVTKPAGKGCVVKGGEVKTNEIAATSKGLTNQLEITPAAGTEFASLTIQSCTVAGLNNTFPVTGSLKLATSGATTTSTHSESTTQNTLKFAGQKTGLDGAITIKNSKGSGLALT
jgi:hypothetical protein